MVTPNTVDVDAGMQALQFPDNAGTMKVAGCFPGYHQDAANHASVPTPKNDERTNHQDESLQRACFRTQRLFPVR